VRFLPKPATKHRTKCSIYIGKKSQSGWIENLENFEPKSKKIIVWRGSGGTKIDENHGLGGLGGSWSSLGVWWVICLKFSENLSSKMSQLVGQVGSKLRPRVAKMLPRWLSWSLFSILWDDFWSILRHFWCHVRG
jgi:hypothetical protein